MSDKELSQILNLHLELKKEESRNYIGASQIGHDCERKIWYELNGEHQEFSPRTKLIFQVGHALEKVILDNLKEAGLDIITDLEQQKQKHFEAFKGTPDAIWVKESGEMAVIDIKTCKNSSYNTFVSKGLKTWSLQYYSQLQSYMGMMGINEAYLFAINKETCDVHDERIEFDELWYEGLVYKATHIYEAITPPQKINKSPLFYKCRMCPFKEKCHG